MIITYFGLVDDWLSWKVGNGKSVWIGQDPWIGCTAFIQFMDCIINSLTNCGIFFLHQIRNNEFNNLRKFWLSMAEIDLNDYKSRILV